MRILLDGLAAFAALALVGLGAQPTLTDEQPPTTWVDGVEVTVPGIGSPDELEDFLTSSTPKTVVLDVDSGRVVAVGPDEAVALS